MQRNLTRIVVGVVIVIAALVLVVALQPDTTHVERSVLVDAEPADVFPYANDLRRSLEWSPWTELDPDQEIAFSETTSGVGAWYTWDGNDEVGKGRQEILESVEDERVVTSLEFIEPFESRATASVLLTPEGDDTRVTWAFDTQNGFAAKAMGLFMDMDEALGPDFEKGLAKLKPLAEAAAAERRAEEARAAAEAAEPEVRGAGEGEAQEATEGEPG